MAEALKGKEEYETHLPLNREVKILTYLDEDTKPRAGRTSAKLGVDLWEEEPIGTDEDGYKTYSFLPGEIELWDACDLFQKRLQDTLGELPGCSLISIGHKAPVPDAKRKISN